MKLPEVTLIANSLAINEKSICSIENDATDWIIFWNAYLLHNVVLCFPIYYMHI